jgi:hypothetical protein
MILASGFVVSCGEFFYDMELKALLNNGLVGYWPIIGTSPNQNDYSGYGNIIHFSNTYSFTLGKFGTACSFGSNGTALSTGTITNINLSQNNSLSISCWMYLVTVTSETFIINVVHPTTSPFMSFNTGSDNQLRFSVSTPAYVRSPGLTLNTWHYVAGTYDGRVIRLYIDGVLAGETPSLNQLINPTDIRFHTGGTGDDLYLDEVRIYDRALSQDEIKELMSIGME